MTSYFQFRFLENVVLCTFYVILNYATRYDTQTRAIGRDMQGLWRG